MKRGRGLLALLTMGVACLACIAYIAWPASGQSAAPSTLLVSNLEGGAIAGSSAHGVRWYKGIPFAAPATGALRWRAPQPVVPWQGTRDASQFAPDCLQAGVADASHGANALSEDCLYLNVWAPAQTRSVEARRPAREQNKAKLPVLVWIHGGGWVIGGSSTPSDDGSAFARRGIVFVSANYRLGRFGFFTHPALIAESASPGEPANGNFGYLDQLAALRWVQRNIAKFGGDPHQVSVMGESAGAASILHLISSGRAHGLFQRAVLMSGGGRTHLMGGRPLQSVPGALPSAEQLGLVFAERAGVRGTGVDALRALRALPAEVVRGDLDMSTREKSQDTYAQGPIVDGVTLRETPEQALLRGQALRIPVLIGTTSADIVLNAPASREHPLAGLASDERVARAAYDPEAQLNAAELYMRVGADMTMHEPARFVADQLAPRGSYLYRFDYVLEALRNKGKSQGAPHASEVPFAFQTLGAVHSAVISPRDSAMAEQFQRYLTSFVTRGDPNTAGLPRWRKHDPRRRELMLFGPSGASMQPDPWRARLDLVERAAAAN